MKYATTTKEEAAIRRYFLRLLLEELPARAAADPTFPANLRRGSDFVNVVLCRVIGPDWVSSVRLYTLREPLYRALPLCVMVRAIAQARIMLTEGWAAWESR